MMSKSTLERCNICKKGVLEPIPRSDGQGDSSFYGCRTCDDNGEVKQLFHPPQQEDT